MSNSRYKILSLNAPDTTCFFSSDALPAFPTESGQLADYFRFLTPIIDQCRVTKLDTDPAKNSRLQWIVAVKNIVRIVQAFHAEDLDKILNQDRFNETALSTVVRFCIYAENRYKNSDIDDKKWVYQSIFIVPESDSADRSDSPNSANSSDSLSTGTHIIHQILRLYPASRKSGESDGEEAREIKRGSSDLEGRQDSNSPASSEGREDRVSLTNATLRRLLKNTWLAQRSGFDPHNNAALSLLWNPRGMIGQQISLEYLETAIASFPIEIGFLWNETTNTVLDVAIGTSNQCHPRDLTDAEIQARNVIVFHNHPRGDTFSIGDILFAIKKGFKEVRVVTLQEDRSIPSYKIYRAEMPVIEKRELFAERISEFYSKVSRHKSTIEFDDEHGYSLLEQEESFFQALNRFEINTRETCKVFPYQNQDF